MIELLMGQKLAQKTTRYFRSVECTSYLLSRIFEQGGSAYASDAARVVSYHLLITSRGIELAD